MMNSNGVVKKIYLGLICATGWFPLAHASSQLLPGITTGLPLGVPLPTGVYDVALANYGVRDGDPKVKVGALAPTWLIWATPWTVVGGRLTLDTVTPAVNVGVDKHNYTELGNTLVEAQLKWDMGSGLSAGLQSGVFLPAHNKLTDLGVTRNFTSFMEVAAMTYDHNGWQLDGTGVYGSGKKGDSLGESAGPAWINYDLTAMKHLDKQWDVGAVAFGSRDVSTPVEGYQRQSQFAAGGIVGYHLGSNLLQVKVTRDLNESNYTGKETRVWLNLILPLWSPK
jgi:hypothetical protein